jgi:thiol-disulfide isomerase/thioredoxin
VGALLVIVAQLATAAPSLEDASAATVENALRPEAGRPRLIHVWASWCMPCTAELPELAAGLRRRADRVDVVLLSLDPHEQAQEAAALLARAGRPPGRALRAISGAALLPLRALDAEWDGALPTTWLIAPDGHLLLAQRGGSDLPALWQAIDRTKPRRRR